MPDYDSFTWCDHDEDCHGRIMDHIDDPDYENGFEWSCCENSGGYVGCKSTRHKASVNRVVEGKSLKRRAEEETSRGYSRRRY